MANDWAILIGINHYDLMPPTAQLRYAVQDVQAMHKFLCSSEMGFNPDHVLLCISDLPSDDHSLPVVETVTTPRRSILRKLLKDVEKKVRKADTLWFFYAGHGMVGNDKHDYLIPQDGDPSDLIETAITIPFVIDCLRSSQAQSIVLVLDMCRNERADLGQRSLAEAGIKVGIETDKLVRKQGIITLFSCTRDQVSYEVPELGQGIFTYALLEGLKNHKVLSTLDQYLIERVRELSLKYRKKEQTPCVVVEPGWRYNLPLLGRNLSQPDVSHLRNQADKFLAGNSDLVNNFLDPIIKFAPNSEDRCWALDKIKSSPSVSDPSRRRVMQILYSFCSFALGATTYGIATKTYLKLKPFESTPTLSFSNFNVVTVNDRGQETTKYLSQSPTLINQLSDEIILEFVQIPEGFFQMGSPQTEDSNETEKPLHLVKIKSFLMSKYPITQAQWSFVATLTKIRLDLKSTPSHFKGLDRPVESISWTEALEFCQRLSKLIGHQSRLPSEAEWEYACRARTTSPFHFGETLTPDLANYDGRYPYQSELKGVYREETTLVGNFGFSNAFGLYDMHGNVWEWCCDYWHENYQGVPPLDGKGWVVRGDNSLRVVRGGSWSTMPKYCRSASRSSLSFNSSRDSVGFRVVFSLA